MQGKMSRSHLQNINIDNVVECLRKRITEITDNYEKNPETVSFAHRLSETLSDVVRTHNYNPSMSGESSHNADDLISFNKPDSPVHHVNIPIVGYEVMEERARFTVYKLKVENKVSGDSWFVYRRYTDFARLHSKLKGDFPDCNFILPRKRWFGNNFDERFLEERLAGLQTFVNDIVNDQQWIAHPYVRAFFCLDEPSSNNSLDESKVALFEALDEIIYNFNKVILKKEKLIEAQKCSIKNLQQKTLEWAVNVCNQTRECKNCNEKVLKSLSEFQQGMSTSSSKETVSLQSDKSSESPTSSTYSSS